MAFRAFIALGLTSAACGFNLRRRIASGNAFGPFAFADFITLALIDVFGPFAFSDFTTLAIIDKTARNTNRRNLKLEPKLPRCSNAYAAYA